MIDPQAARGAAEDDDDLTASDLLALARRERRAEDAAAARQLDLAARWADLHPPESIHHAEIPRECVLLFGREGPGLSAGARALCRSVLSIPQFGSTRSINAGSASAVAMAEWCRRWAESGPRQPR